MSKIEQLHSETSQGQHCDMVTPPDEEVFYPRYTPTASIRISSWSQFFSLVHTMTYGEWYYRGHQDSSWSLRTGLDRVREVWNKRFSDSFPATAGDGPQLLKDYDFRAYDNCKPFERNLELTGIREFRSLTKGRFDPSFTNLDYLGVMQHYGTKTRLLDFSFSPFVAAFFAFENEEVFSERAIYAINFNRFQQCSPMMTEVGKFIGREIGDELTAFAEERLVCIFGDQCPNSWEVYRAIAEMDISQSEADALECDDIIPVVLEGMNDRIIAQDGLFLLPLTFDYFDIVLAKMLKIKSEAVRNPVLVEESKLDDLYKIIAGATLIKFVFDKRMNDSAHQALRQMNVSCRSIYPDLIGVARHINSVRTDIIRERGNV